MEGFWGILKREMYYGKRFTSKEELIQGIQDYIEYYNNRRLQRKLHIMTPMAFHELTLKAVLWSSIFVTLMANKIGGLQFGIYRNCQISSRVFHTAVAALPLTKANRSDFE